MTRIAAARPIAADPSEPPRVGVGHNRPPVDEMARIDFNEAIVGHDGLLQRIAALIDSAGRAQATTDEEAARCAELIRQMAAAEKVVDAERTATKAPYLAAGRAIDDAAKTLVHDLGHAKGNVRALAEDYLREKQRKADEVARLVRIEAERQAAEARQRAAEEAARAAAENREPEPLPEPEPVFVSQPEPERATVRSDFGAVASARKVKVAVITDWNKAYKRVQKIPAVREAVQKAINGLMRAGEVNIPGVDIREDVGLSVR